jgi:chorismate mutase/prephenate dehydratase
MTIENENKVKVLRQKIETVDGEILRLLDERAKIAMDVGKLKTEGKMEFYDPQREGQIIAGLTKKSTVAFPQRAVQSVFREIISACRSLEVELTVAYLGPAASYTHLASVKHFGSSIRTVPEETIEKVFEAVESKKVGYGVVPVENSTEGAVDRTLDVIAESTLTICGEVLLRISHHLLSQTGRRTDIEEIHSHPQALGQCRGWLMKNFPNTSLVEATSTAKAAEIASGNKKAAAIASSFAAEHYGLNVIESRIEDEHHNYTRFLVLGTRSSGRTGNDKTSILFSIPHAPGTLYQVLKIFSGHGINLTKIESRPMRGKPWEYVFFVDVDGHATDDPIEEAVIELKKTALLTKLLGSYPKASFEAADS